MLESLKKLEELLKDSEVGKDIKKEIALRQLLRVAKLARREVETVIEVVEGRLCKPRLPHPCDREYWPDPCHPPLVRN